MKENVSIKRRIFNVILIIISFLIMTGCTIAVMIFSNVLITNKVQYLEAVLEDLYRQTVDNSREYGLLEAQSIARSISHDFNGNLTDSALYRNLEGIFPDKHYAVYDLSWSLHYTNKAEVFELFLENPLHFVSEDFIAGSSDLGLWTFCTETLTNAQKEPIGYVVVVRQISQPQLIAETSAHFRTEATFFYKDTRTETTVENDSQDARGTKLDPSIAAGLLKAESTYFGRSSLFGNSYLVSYKSFGNPGQAPVGILGVGEPLDTYNRSLAKLVLSVVALGLSLFTISLIVANRWLDHTVVRPMIVTTDAMARIAQGKFGSRLPEDLPRPYLEFSRLNDSILKMVSELENSNRKMEQIAFYDELTQLPNRFYLQHKCDPAHNTAAQPIFYLILLDLDNLRTVNDLYGRHIGDQLLLQIALMIRSVIESCGHCELLRIGGDEFVILVREEIPRSTVETLAQKLLMLFKEPFFSDDFILTMTVSIGLAARITPYSVETMLQYAEIAMYEVKTTGKNHYRFFEQEMGDRLRLRKDMETDLEAALSDKTLFLVYQPKLNLRDQSCTTFEALIRWNHPSRGFVSPAEFIGLAEQSGLIIPIGQFVLEQACRDVRQLMNELNTQLRVAVNISPLQLNREDFISMVVDTMKAHQLEPRHLELEITESLLMSSFDSAVLKLRQLSDMGIGISVDDFGKGYSSLAYLQELPISTLKIDKMFVDAIELSPDNMVGDLVRLGHHLGLNIIAEGVETKTQLDYLAQVECDMVQGYYYSKPIVLEDLKQFIQSNALKSVSLV